MGPFRYYQFLRQSRNNGSIYEFKFEGHHVSARLPRPEHADRAEQFDDVISVSSFRADTGEVLSYRVMKVEVDPLVKTVAGLK